MFEQHNGSSSARAQGSPIFSRGRITLPTLLYKLGAIFALAYYFINLQRMLTGSDTLYLIVTPVAGIVGWLSFFVGRLKNKLSILILTLLFVFSGLMNILFVGNVSPSMLINEILLFGIGILLLQGCLSVRQAVYFIYATLSLFALYWILGANSARLLTSSRNYISVLLILHVCIFYAVLEENGKPIPILPSFFCFLISIWATGRSGILCTGILVIAITLVNRTQAKKTGRFFFFRSVLLVLIFGALLVFFTADTSVSAYLQSSLLQFTKFQTYSMDNTARMIIWSSYWNAAFDSFFNLFFGANLFSIPLIAQYAGNTHNSFFQLHAYHGLFIFVLFMCLVVSAFVYFFRKKKYVHFIVFFVLCLRAFFDKMIFIQYGIPVMLYFVFYPVVNDRKYSIKREKIDHS